MNAAQAEQSSIPNWKGGAWFRGVGNKKLGMWLFILSDSLTFAALLASYVYLRAASSVWPRSFSFSPEILFATLMTLCLLVSSWTMVKAVKASARGDRAKIVRWLMTTIAAGSAFVALHLMEWKHLLGDLTAWNYEIGLGIRETMPATWSADASPLFGAVFFTITGFHLLHVLSGLIYLTVMASRRSVTREAVEICGLYWQFVDVVWLVILPAIYLFSMK